MDLEAVIYGYIPILIGILEIISSSCLTSKKRKIFNFIFSIIISASNTLAIYILIQILIGAYPNYTPHIFIGISTILLVIQYFINRKKKNVCQHRI